jgi:hypothetical protein
MPHKFGPDGPSSRTPQRNRLPTSLSSKSTLAVKQGQPSSALPGVIGVSLQVCAKRPELSQLPASRALRKMSRFKPVKYLNWMTILAMALLHIGLVYVDNAPALAGSGDDRRQLVLNRKHEPSFALGYRM